MISQSIRTGFNFCLITANAFEIIVKLGTIISSFFFKSNDLIAISKAAVPLDTATEYFCLILFENFLSKDSTSGPSEEIQPFFKTVLTDFIS